MNSLFEKVKKFDEVYIYGFGISGKWLSAMLSLRNINLIGFIDSDLKKLGFSYNNYSVMSYTQVIDRFKGSSLKSVSRVIINTVVDIQDLWDKLDNSPFFSVESLGIYLDGSLELFAIEDATANYLRYSLDAVKYSHLAFFKNENKFLRSIDLQITERCSMKCQDCSNLMQYYEKPLNITVEKLKSDLDKLLIHLDHLFEVRLIGGEPFVHPDIYELISHCTNLDKVSYVSIFTNSTLPLNYNKLKSDAIEAQKLSFQITNYGGSHARNVSGNLSVLQSLCIDYRLHEPEWWTDSGTILEHQKSVEEAKVLFQECCGKNLFTISDGKVYRCPFASNADRLGALPSDSSNFADLNSNTSQLLNYLGDIDYIPACMFCKGRSWNSPIITPAIQTRKPLSYNKLSN